MSTSTSSQNAQNDPKAKKTFQKVKSKSDKHYTTFNKTNEIFKEVSTKSTAKQKSENNSTESNNHRNFLKHPSVVSHTGMLIEDNFFTNLKDFPELKVNNNSSLDEFSAGKNTKTGSNLSWGSRQKKHEALSSSLYKNNNIKNEIDLSSGSNQVIQSLESNNSALCNVSEKQSKIYLNAEVHNTKDPVGPKRNPKKRKRSDPVFINLHDILNMKKNTTKTRQERNPKSKFRRSKNSEQLSGNYLDSSNPKRMRGKHREVKKKTLTNLKLRIITERIIKKKIRENSVTAYFGDENINFIDNTNFKTEIKNYLEDLSKKKLKKAIAAQNKVKEHSSKVNYDKEVSTTEKNSKKSEKQNKTIPLITPEGEVKFSSKFREYCDNIITPDLNSAVFNLIKESVNLQDKSFLRDPIKAKAKKRHVSGIREVRKYLILKKVKLIVVAPNLEKLQMQGSLQDVINDLKSLANAQNVPYGFALDRYKLGICTKKNLPVSAFAILNYEGIEGLFYNVLDLLKGVKEQFSKMVKPKPKKEEDIKTAEINAKMIASFISAFQTELKISDRKNDSDLK